MVRRVNKDYQSPLMEAYVEEVRRLEERFDELEIEHVPHVENNIVDWYDRFASCLPNVIYNVFMHNNAFWSNSNAFSLIICKVYTKRENTGSWNSGPEKATSELPILHISK